MSIIDWSDPEEMLGLLVEYVRDELTGERHDRERRGFLRSLWGALDALDSQGSLSAREALPRLRSVADEQPSAFASDPALVHVRDCILELERIVVQAPPG